MQSRRRCLIRLQSGWESDLFAERMLYMRHTHYDIPKISRENFIKRWIKMWKFNRACKKDDISKEEFDRLVEEGKVTL